jgi:predicted dehydrogenase
MLNRPIRWGILATGFIADRFTRDLAEVPGAEVVAVGSRTLAAAQEFARVHGIPRAYGSWQELAEDAEVDIVYVSTPHSAHHEATRLCLSAGRAVLCEKPFTLDRETAVDLVDLARERGLFLMEAMWTRTIPAVLRIQELIAEGAIGEVRHVAASFGFVSAVGPDHRLRAPALGGGAALDLGVYPVTFAQLFLGAPDHVRAWATLFPEGTDETTGILLGYDRGAVALLHCGLNADTSGAVITGSRGRIEIPGRFHRPTAFTLVRGDEVDIFEIPVIGEGMSHEAIEAQRCLREGLLESPLVPHADTLAIMATLDEIRAQIGVVYR